MFRCGTVGAPVHSSVIFSPLTFLIQGGCVLIIRPSGAENVREDLHRSHSTTEATRSSCGVLFFFFSTCFFFPDISLLKKSSFPCGQGWRGLLSSRSQGRACHVRLVERYGGLRILGRRILSGVFETDRNSRRHVMGRRRNVGRGASPRHCSCGLVGSGRTCPSKCPNLNQGLTHALLNAATYSSRMSRIVGEQRHEVRRRGWRSCSTSSSSC